MSKSGRPNSPDYGTFDGNLKTCPAHNILLWGFKEKNED